MRSVLLPVLKGFSTMNHSRTALLGGATDRFKRTYLMISRDEAIK